MPFGQKSFKNQFKNLTKSTWLILNDFYMIF